MTAPADPYQLENLLDNLDSYPDLTLLHRVITSSEPDLVRFLVTGVRKKALAQAIDDHERDLGYALVEESDLSDEVRAAGQGLIQILHRIDRTNKTRAEDLVQVNYELACYIHDNWALLSTVLIDGQHLNEYLYSVANSGECNNVFVSRVAPRLEIAYSGTSVTTLLRDHLAGLGIRLGR